MEGRGTCTQYGHSFIYMQTDGGDVGERKITFLCGWFGCKTLPESLTWLLGPSPAGWVIFSTENLKINIKSVEINPVFILTTQTRQLTVKSNSPHEQPAF